MQHMSTHTKSTKTPWLRKAGLRRKELDEGGARSRVEGNRGMEATRREGSRGHANGKLYCRKTNIESAAGLVEGESSRCLLFIRRPTRRRWQDSYGDMHADMLRFYIEPCPPLLF